MSDHIKFVARYITEEVHAFNETEEVHAFDEEEEMDESRRDFIKKITGIVGAVSSPVDMLNKIATGTASNQVLSAVSKTILNMTNEELQETPEELWVPYISSARLKNFMSQYPDHMSYEVVCKFEQLVDYIQSGMATRKGVALRTFDIIRSRTNVNAPELIRRAYSDKNNPWYGVLTQYDPQAVFKTAKIAGVNLDYEFIKKKTMEIRREEEKRADEQAATAEHDWNAVVHGGVEPTDSLGKARYKSAPYFESKNRKTIQF